jgi:hypothetical protein
MPTWSKQSFFLNTTPKAQATKAKLDKWYYVELKSFFTESKQSTK